MTTAAIALEAFLARLYTDKHLRRAFAAQPEQVAIAAGLDPQTASQLAGLDFDGLALAADGFARKRAAHDRRRHRAGLLSRVRDWFDMHF